MKDISNSNPRLAPNSTNRRQEIDLTWWLMWSCQTGPSRVAYQLINPDGTLPYAYLLPKPSEAFEKARPIISYMLSNAKLGQVIGTIVYELCRSIFGELQFDRTVQTIIAEIQCQNKFLLRSIWTFNNKIFLDFSIPSRTLGWSMQSPLQWTTTLMNMDYHQILHWAHQLPKKIAPTGFSDGNCPKQAEDIWTSSFRTYPKWSSFYWNILTSRWETMFSDRYKEHPWAVSSHRHFVD